MPVVARYCLYVDEVGNEDLASAADRKHQYLSLTGVIINTVEYETVETQVHALKQKHLGTPSLCLHRRDLMTGSGACAILQDPARREAFNEDLLTLLNALPYRLITVSIDKDLHRKQYSQPNHAYEYCFRCMLERYVKFLKLGDHQGDIMMEARSSAQDSILKAEYVRFRKHGTDYVNLRNDLKRLTDEQLHFASKADPIAGLELADLIAHPALLQMLQAWTMTLMNAQFGIKVVKAVSSKYLTNPNGRKWLPISFPSAPRQHPAAKHKQM